MKVRILSGNAKGQIIEMGQTEAEVNISTGYAEPFVPPVVVEEKVVKAPRAKQKHSDRE